MTHFVMQPGRFADAGCCSAISSARGRSSGVLTLKNGSTGSSGHSAIATPCRAVQTSILCRSSSTSARRRSSRRCDRPQPRDRMPPVAGLGAGERLVLLQRAPSCRRRDQIARQERAIARHARHPCDFGPMRRGPVEPGEDAGERPGEVRHVVGDHRQAEAREARRIAVGVEDDARRIAASMRRRARDRGWSRPPISISALSPPPMRRASPPARTRPRVGTGVRVTRSDALRSPTAPSANAAATDRQSSCIAALRRCFALSSST